MHQHNDEIQIENVIFERSLDKIPDIEILEPPIGKEVQSNLE